MGFGKIENDVTFGAGIERKKRFDVAKNQSFP